LALTLVCGGGFGDEGKGKVSAYLSLTDKPSLAVRTGSVNAGHTVVLGDRRYKLRLIPSAFANPSTMLVIPPGALVRLDVFEEEVAGLGVEERVLVDPMTGIIEERHREAERRDEVLAGIGSTAQGVGAAMADRVMRRLRLARDEPRLSAHLADTVGMLNDALDQGEDVLIEGSQGLYLSLYHGTYPYVTSRDTSAAAMLSEAGLGPRRADEIIVVFKSYLTRVGEGPLPGEMSVEEAVEKGFYEEATVTGRARRAAPFSLELARRAVHINTATQVAVTKLDVLFPEASGKTRWSDLPREARKWVNVLEEELDTPVTLLGTGEEAGLTIDMRREKLGA
jgi:adenylosuccinate synthase